MSQYPSESAWYVDDVDVDELLDELEALDVAFVHTKPPIHPRTLAQKNSTVKTSVLSSSVYPNSTALLPRYGWFADKTEFSIQSGPGDVCVGRPTTARPSQWQTSSKKALKSSIFQAVATNNLQQQSSQSQIRDSIDILADSFNL